MHLSLHAGYIYIYIYITQNVVVKGKVARNFHLIILTLHEMRDSQHQTYKLHELRSACHVELYDYHGIRNSKDAEAIGSALI
jgi:hypothetical protein